MVTTTIKEIASSYFNTITIEDGSKTEIVTMPKVCADFIIDGVLFQRNNTDRTVDINDSTFLADDAPKWNSSTKRFSPALTTVYATNLTTGCITTPKLASGAITPTTMMTVGTGQIFVGNGTIFTTLSMGSNGHILQVVASNLVWSTGSGGATGPTGPTGVISASSVGSVELNSSAIIARTFDSLVIPARAFASNVITTNILASGILTTAIYVDASITSAKLATNTLTESVFASGIVTTAILVASSITNAKLDSDTVDSRILATGAVTTAIYASNSIDTNALASDAITTEILVDSVVVAAKIATSTITGAKLADGTLGATVMTSNFITTAMYVASTISGAKIDSSTIINRHLDTATIAVGKLAQGTAYQRYRTNSGATAVEWYNERTAISFVFDGGGSTMTLGKKGDLLIPFACSVIGWTIMADQTGSCIVDIMCSSYTAFPHATTDTITGTEKPTLSGAQKNQDNSLTSFITSVNAGDIMTFNLDEANTVQRVTITLDVVKQG